MEELPHDVEEVRLFWPRHEVCPRGRLRAPREGVRKRRSRLHGRLLRKTTGSTIIIPALMTTHRADESPCR